jgi:hypothetical protein
MGLMDILTQYAEQASAPTSRPMQNAHEDFSTVATQATPQQLGGGIAQALQRGPAGFEGSIAQLFENSNTDQRTGLLQRLIRAVQPGALSSIAGGALSHLAPPGTSVQPSDANAVTPAQAGELAAAAQQNNGGIVQELGAFYAQHPTLVKTLGAAALAMAMNHMAKTA